MKIIHVVPKYPPSLGGMQKVVETLANLQFERGDKVSVITSKEGYSEKQHPKLQGLPVHRLKSFNIANTPIMPSLIFRLLRVRKNSVIHLHVASAYTPEIVWLASKIKGFKYILHLHLDVAPSGPAGFLLKAYKPLVLRRVINAANIVIVFTKDQKLNIQGKYNTDPSKIRVIPNGVDTRFYYAKPRSFHEKLRLLFVGRLSIQKNLLQLLQALVGVSDQFETNIVGDGKLEAELKKVTRDLKLENVNFYGRAEGSKLLQFYKKADIFVLPSEREGMPLVLLEAIAMGLPIVATDVTGNRDVVVDGENGILAKLHDPDSLRSALLKIKSNRELYSRMSIASSELASQYSWDKVITAFDRVYQELSA